MQKLKILDLFSGLGGFSLGLERTGRYKTVAFCEIDKYCTLLLQKHWKGIKVYNDVKKITKEGFEADGIESPDIITGGFPCQPFSVAGKQKGTSDDRHLWPEMFRIIKAFKPRFVIGENVPGIVNIQDGVVFETVCTDLESQGYEVQPFNIPAAAVGAPHQRKRIWIIASLENSGRTLQQGSSIREKNEDEVGKENANQHQRSSSSSESNVANANIDGAKRNQPEDGQRSRTQQSSEDVADSNARLSDGQKKELQSRGQASISSSERKNVANTDSERLEGLGQSRSQFNETSSSTSRSEERQGQVGQGWWEFEPNVGRVAHGVPGRVHRLKALGNSIVPQIAEEIGRAIIKAADDA